MHRFSIGRQEDCDVVLQGPSVSRCHAYLTLMADKSIHFEDAGSTNGSYLIEGLNLVRITSAELRPEARLQLGKERISVGEILFQIRESLRRRG